MLNTLTGQFLRGVMLQRSDIIPLTTGASMTVKPFKVQVAPVVLKDLKDRLARTRWPDEIPAAAWDYGTDMAYLRELLDYWQHDFDWPTQERLLNSHPQFMADVQGKGLHFVHVKGKGPNPVPLLISHGWPGSYFEMYKIIGPLSDPESYGGDPFDAFDIVVPSLPGYGFSEKPRMRGVNIAWIADLFARLMTDVLGYQTFGAQGGDWGALITAQLGRAHAKHVSGIHLNFVPRFGGPVPPVLEGTAELQAWREETEYWQREEAAYSRIQGTKPQTLAYGLNDSPAGLAAWIVEKFRSWSDCNGNVESVYTKDEMLTNIMIYWVTETINSSTRPLLRGCPQPLGWPFSDSSGDGADGGGHFPDGDFEAPEIAC